jgi:hypothetical protein
MHNTVWLSTHIFVNVDSIQGFIGDDALLDVSSFVRCCDVSYNISAKSVETTLMVRKAVSMNNM